MSTLKWKMKQMLFGRFLCPALQAFLPKSLLWSVELPHLSFVSVTSPGFGITLSLTTVPKVHSFFWVFLLIDLFIYCVVDAFYSQIWSQETHLTLAAVLIPSYGLLTQMIPRCFIIAVSHFSAAWHAGRSMQHVKPLWKDVRMKSDMSIWFHRENFRRQNIISQPGNCRDSGTLYITNVVEAFIWLIAHHQELHLFSRVKMHYLTLVLWF